MKEIGGGLYKLIFLGLMFSSSAWAQSGEMACDYLDQTIKSSFDMDCGDIHGNPGNPSVAPPASRQGRTVSDFKQKVCGGIPHIPASCIAESIKENKDNGSSHSYACANDSATVFKKQKSPRPCGTKTMVDYLAAETNRALSCINSDGDKLSSKEVFAIINHESRFTPNVASPGGVGLMQLTTTAVNAFYTPEVKPVWDNVKNRSECQGYAQDDSYLSDNGENSVIRHGKKGYISWCQFLNIKTNPSRSLIMGLSLYKAYKKKILRRLNRDGIQVDGNSDLVKRITEEAYNKGSRAALRAYKHEKQIFLGDKTKLKLNALEAFDYNARLNDLKEEVERRYLALMPKPKEGANPTDEMETPKASLPPLVDDTLTAVFGSLAFQHNQKVRNQNASPQDLKSQFVTRDEVLASFKEAASKAENDEQKKIFENVLDILKSKKLKDYHFLYADRIERDLKKVEENSSCKLTD